MRIIKFVGLVIGLAALFGCAAEAPSAAPPVESVSVGMPIPLAPTPGASPGVAPDPLTAPYRSGTAPNHATSVTIDHSYHPSWTVDVYGFQ
jgi:hypothetical protein